MTASTTPTAIRAAETRESTVTVDGQTVRYWEAGSGRPIVFLHRGSGPLWSPTHDLLSDSHRVIMVQLPGFGTSDYVPTGTTKDYAALVHQAAREIADGSYDLVGNSFGGLVAAWIAVQFPADIRSVVLVGPGIFVRPAQPIVATEETFDRITALEKAHPDRHYPQPLSSETKVKHLEVLQHLLVPEDPELLAGLATLRVPTLVIFGTEDQITPPDFGRKYPALNAAIFLSFVYDAGHAVDGDRPESLAHTIGLFTEHGFDYLIERGRTLLFP
ncbi:MULTISPECIES: alpha/beta fold hydrolase [unclassified Mycolicibacterium]|uniref:alpha/beta fold hydrolase n=1 Tax=unclassified Mycolicibacterium TaxID=2636767 RepID=UPI002EDA1A64